MSFFCVDLRTLLLMAALFSSLGHAQNAPLKPAGDAPQAAPVIQQQAPATNGITQAAVQQGVLNCASRINQVSNFLGFNNQSGAVLMTPPNAQDQHLIPLAMEIPTASGSAYVSAQFAPNQANG